MKNPVVALVGVVGVGCVAVLGYLGFRVLRVAGVIETADDWTDYAPGSEFAGQEIPKRILSAITSARGAVPVEKGIKKQGAGYYYMGDAAQTAYLSNYLGAKADSASPVSQRQILAFKALQGQEGSTIAINTYDNQILTYGTGWGGLGTLPKVMARMVANKAIRDRFLANGMRFKVGVGFEVVDLDAGHVVSGGKPALKVIRVSLPLLYLLIDVGRSVATRDAVTDAQLATFLETSANIPGSGAIATQALFNFIVHLNHWAPGYVKGVLAWTVPQAGENEPSEGRDCRMAVLIGRYFYGKAQGKWIPDWKQFQSYWRRMKQDGLDCTDQDFIKADLAPTDDPFASV